MTARASTQIEVPVLASTQHASSVLADNVGMTAGRTGEPQALI
jgi:hypothetical protein